MQRTAATFVFVLTMLPIVTGMSAEPPISLEPALWNAYRTRFIENGRVIDNYQGSISHSEGQGYGMLMAEAAGDKAGFDQIWEWTRKVLQRKDGLFSWRYEHCAVKDTSCITDTNNASDGDILIAWALLRAHRRWQSDDYYRSTQRIVGAIARKLLVRHKDHLLLLPGSKGFADAEKLTLNASYWVFPALEDFSQEFNQPHWNDVIASGKWLLQHARFGEHQLPADWMELSDGTLTLSEKFPPRYSYDAVRILLHQAWSQAGITKAELAPYLSYWSHTSPPPAWFDLKTNTSAGFSWNTGMAAIANLAQHRAFARNGEPKLPRPAWNDGYFSWSLTLLAHIAAKEMPR